jgi:hypothetical protein
MKAVPAAVATAGAVLLLAAPSAQAAAKPCPERDGRDTIGSRVVVYYTGGGDKTKFWACDKKSRKRHAIAEGFRRRGNGGTEIRNQQDWTLSGPYVAFRDTRRGLPGEGDATTSSNVLRVFKVGSKLTRVAGYKLADNDRTLDIDIGSGGKVAYITGPDMVGNVTPPFRGYEIWTAETQLDAGCTNKVAADMVVSGDRVTWVCNGETKAARLRR